MADEWVFVDEYLCEYCRNPDEVKSVYSLAGELEYGDIQRGTIVTTDPLDSASFLNGNSPEWLRVISVSNGIMKDVNDPFLYRVERLKNFAHSLKAVDEEPAETPTTTGEPTGEEPSGNEPTGEEPNGEEPSGEEPNGEEPSGEEPNGEEPNGSEPTGEEPTG